MTVLPLQKSERRTDHLNKKKQTPSKIIFKDLDIDIINLKMKTISHYNIYLHILDLDFICSTSCLKEWIRQQTFFWQFMPFNIIF